MGLGNLEKKLLIGAILSSIFFSCSDEINSPIQQSTNSTPTNPPTTENSAPVFSSSPITSINEKDDYNYQLRANDANGDKLTFSIKQAPSWISISNEGLLKGRAPEITQNSSSNVSVSVSDGKLSATQNYTLTIKNLLNNYVFSGNEINGMNIEENKITFSNPVNYVVGDILAAGITTKTPTGFLRKITTVSSDKKVVSTKQATLEEATKYCFFSYNGSLNSTDLESSLLSEGMGLSKRYDSNGFTFDIIFKDVVLYDVDKNEETKSDQLIANGKVSFSTDYQFDLTIGDYKIQELKFNKKSNVKSELTLSSNAFGISSILEKEIAQFKFKPFVVAYLPTLPPIPIVVVPEIGVVAGINSTSVNPLSVTFKENADLDIGITYWGGNLIPSFEFSNNFEFSNPIIKKEINLSVYAGPRLDLLLYGIAGPFGAIRGKARINYSNEKWSLYGGLEASLGVKMDILSHHISAKFQNIINNEKLIASGGGSENLEGKIVFASVRNNNADIYTINPDGSAETRLTYNSSDWDVSPSWSPDGTKIIYSSLPYPTKDHDIYVMNSDGSNKTRLTSSSMHETNPVFSKDGTKIAYSAAYVSGHDQIYVMNSDGSSPKPLTNDDPHFYWDISWTPGSKILCASNKDNSIMEIYSINSDGSGLKRLTNNSYYDRLPSWSPDGTKIAFTSERDGNSEIYVMNSDGSNQRNISNSSNTEDIHPSWSPDGTKIVYVSKSKSSFDESNEIWIMDSNGLNKKRVTNNSYSDSSPSWSPK